MLRMSSHRRLAAPGVRTAAFATLLAAGLTAQPVPARAADTDAAPMATPQTNAPAITPAKGATEANAETVEQRIDSLHAALKITASEEPAWKEIATAMRENASAMEKLVADRAAIDPKEMTAVDNLKSYQAFTQAHVDGLKNLIASFDTLYSAMPDAQKKIADHVFATFGHGHGQKHG